MEGILNGPFGRTILGPVPLTIGRTSDNRLVVNDQSASQHHAEIRPEGQGYYILDAGSTNHTFINEYRLTPNMPRSLNSGDSIRSIGSAMLLLAASPPLAQALPGSSHE